MEYLFNYSLTCATLSRIDEAAGANAVAAAGNKLTFVESAAHIIYTYSAEPNETPYVNVGATTSVLPEIVIFCAVFATSVPFFLIQK